MGEPKSGWGLGLRFKGISSRILGDDLAGELEPLPPPKPAVRPRPRVQTPKRDSDEDSAASATATPPRTRSRSPKQPWNNKNIRNQLRGLKKSPELSSATPVRDSLNSAMVRRRSSAAGGLPQAPFEPAHPPRSLPESQASDTTATLTQEQVNVKVKVLMNHPALWAEFKDKLGKHQNANSHGTVRVVMQEFLREHGDELEDETTSASASPAPSKRSSLIFNAFAGFTGESSRRLGDEAVVNQMDTYYRTARKAPSRSKSNSSSKSKGRPSLQKGGFASLSMRAMNNLAGEEAPVVPIIVSDSDLPTKRERPGLQKSGLASLSTRAMNSFAGEASVAVGESSAKQSRARPTLQKGSLTSLSTRAMNSLAGEAEETMETGAQRPQRPSMGSRSSLSARNVMAAITNNIANEASQSPPFTSSVSVSELNSNGEPHRSSSWISSVLPITKESSQTSVPKPSARSSWRPAPAFASLSGEVRIAAQPTQTNGQAPPAPPLGSNVDDLQSVDLNGSSHHKNQHAEVSHAPSSGGLVGTLRRVSLLFSHDIQLELEAANRTQAAASALLDEALTTDGISLCHESVVSLEFVLEEEEAAAEAEKMLRSASLLATMRKYKTRDEASKQNSTSSLSFGEFSIGETDPIAEESEEQASSGGSMGEVDTPKEEELPSVPTLEDTPKEEELISSVHLDEDDLL
jgi:hypothetical protein